MNIPIWKKPEILSTDGNLGGSRHAESERVQLRQARMGMSGHASWSARSFSSVSYPHARRTLARRLVIHAVERLMHAYFKASQVPRFRACYRRFCKPGNFCCRRRRVAKRRFVISNVIAAAAGLLAILYCFSGSSNVNTLASPVA